MRKKMLFVASVVSTGLSFTSAFADLANEQVACNASQTAAVEAALVEASLDIEEAANALEIFNNRTRAKFERWFGSSDENAILEVISIYGDAEANWYDQDLWCPTVNRASPDYDKNAIAHVYLGADTDIFLSPKFFRMSLRGEESQASSVLHELMHSSGAHLDPDSYTVEEAEWLAQNYPGDARRNAQNLEYFAIDIVYGN